MKIPKIMKEFAIITVGTAIVAAAVFFFMLPSHVSVGSGAALSMVLSNYIPLSVALSSALCYDSKTVVLSLLGDKKGGNCSGCRIDDEPVYKGIIREVLSDECDIDECAR